MFETYTQLWANLNLGQDVANKRERKYTAALKEAKYL